jgi:hypothetical protein
MAKNLYSKYSLYQQKVRKGKRNLLLLLSFFFLVAAVFFIGINLKGKTLFGNITPTPAPEVQGTTQVTEDEPENLLTWWSYDYSIYRQLTVRNQEAIRSVPKDSLLSVNINHANLVSENKSLASGNDLRVVYLNEGNTYTELEIKLDDPNTSYTKISFKSVKDIPANNMDNKYFLYYGNPAAVRYDSAVKTGNLTDLDYLISYSKEQSPKLLGQVNRKWVLKEDPDSGEFKFTVTADIDGIKDNQNVTYQIIGTNRTGFLKHTTENTYESAIEVKDLVPGIYSIQASTIANNMEVRSQKSEFYVSYPLYVAWTFDWEGFDVNDNYLNDMNSLSNQHGVPLTHFFNPRIYIATDISNARKDYLTNWVLNRKSTNGDQIELHLHMHYDVVTAAGLTPKTSPAWGGRENGHDVLTSAYNYSEMVQMLNWAKGIFEQKGLGTPSAFRAGGWYASLDTLKALQDTGFTMDSSGRTYYVYGPNKVKGPWTLLSTTVPYHPSASNQNVAGKDDALKIWEFPNNGADSWSYSANDLIQRFKENYSNAPLQRKQIVTYLTHPHGFNVDQPKMDATFSYIDNYLYKNDSGPVKYVTLEQAEKMWDTYGN